MANVIEVESLSKFYRLGVIGGRTLRDDLERGWARIRGRADPLIDASRRTGGNVEGENLWALRGLDFTVRQGEILGIIGKNGAGKSTLLKILSKITAPTSGRVRMKGRTGSLLEVGTGFHPELTGRENVYLNGAILGMSRSEIDSKFDEIVDFSGVGAFIDTPVKRYSSGMGVRLGFAVAAHLEPEILIIDEVLAVGDAEFQKRCLGKMSEVAGAGRTVLFVSHNMSSIRALCDRGLLLVDGEIALDGGVDEVVGRYLLETVGDARTPELVWSEGERPGNDAVQLAFFRLSASVTDGSAFPSDHPIRVSIGVVLKDIHSALCIGFDMMDASGAIVLRSYQTDGSEDEWPPLEPGLNVLHTEIPAGFLNGGAYYLRPIIGLHNIEWIVLTDRFIRADVSLRHSPSPFWTGLRAGARPGAVAPVLRWQVDEAGHAQAGAHAVAGGRPATGRGPG